MFSTHFVFTIGLKVCVCNDGVCGTSNTVLAFLFHTNHTLSSALAIVLFHPLTDHKDTRVRARSSNTRGDHFLRHKNKSIYPNDTRVRARISNTRGDHFWQLSYKSLHSKDTRFRAKIEAVPSLHFEPFSNKTVPSFQNTCQEPTIWSTSCQNLQSRRQRAIEHPTVSPPLDFRY